MALLFFFFAMNTDLPLTALLWHTAACWDILCSTSPPMVMWLDNDSAGNKRWLICLPSKNSSVVERDTKKVNAETRVPIPLHYHGKTFLCGMCRRAWAFFFCFPLPAAVLLSMALNPQFFRVAGQQPTVRCGFTWLLPGAQVCNSVNVREGNK